MASTPLQVPHHSEQIFVMKVRVWYFDPLHDDQVSTPHFECSHSQLTPLVLHVIRIHIMQTTAVTLGMTEGPVCHNSEGKTFRFCHWSLRKNLIFFLPEVRPSHTQAWWSRKHVDWRQITETKTVDTVNPKLATAHYSLLTQVWW